MWSRVQFHSPVKIAAYTLGCSLVIVAVFAGLTHSLRRDAPDSNSDTVDAIEFDAVIDTLGFPLLPVIELNVVDASMEANWSSALAAVLSGQTEKPVQGGRVDVLTAHYAIEVDRLDKWHEGIGQAAHYGLLTNGVPVLAIIVPSDNWPLSEQTRAKLLLIDRTCTAQNVKLVLLRRSGMR